MSEQSRENSSEQTTSPIMMPPECLAFTVRGPWGHFRRVEGNIVKQTYKIIPRTTVSGLLAGILGIERDQYYELFGPGCSAIAIEPVEPLRTLNIPVNTLSTAKKGMTSLNGRGKLSIRLPDPAERRQQHNYEVLVDPAYRIYLWLADKSRFNELASMLESGKSHYIPSLGLSEYIADIDYHGRYDVSVGAKEGVTAVDSAVPDAIEQVVPDQETRCHVEKSPAFMSADDRGRKTTCFTRYVFNPDAGSLNIKNQRTSLVDGRNVVFV
jgi:CRISPR-associated protein Cas5h